MNMVWYEHGNKRLDRAARKVKGMSKVQKLYFRTNFNDGISFQDRVFLSKQSNFIFTFRYFLRVISSNFGNSKTLHSVDRDNVLVTVFFFK